MTTERKIRRPEPPKDGLLDQARLYLQLRTGRESLAKNEDKLKGEFMKALESFGADESGHRFYIFPEGPIEGPGGKPIYGFKRERRAPQVMDPERAMELIEKYKLQDTCIDMVPVINEEGLLAANYDDKIPDDEFKTIYTENEGFAFVLVKEPMES